MFERLNEHVIMRMVNKRHISLFCN